MYSITLQHWLQGIKKDQPERNPLNYTITSVLDLSKTKIMHFNTSGIIVRLS